MASDKGPDIDLSSKDPVNKIDLSDIKLSNINTEWVPTVNSKFQVYSESRGWMDGEIAKIENGKVLVYYADGYEKEVDENDREMLKAPNNLQGGNKEDTEIELVPRDTNNDKYDDQVDDQDDDFDENGFPKLDENMIKNQVITKDYTEKDKQYIEELVSKIRNKE